MQSFILLYQLGQRFWHRCELQHNFCEGIRVGSLYLSIKHDFCKFLVSAKLYSYMMYPFLKWSSRVPWGSRLGLFRFTGVTKWVDLALCIQCNMQALPTRILESSQNLMVGVSCWPISGPPLPGNCGLSRSVKGTSGGESRGRISMTLIQCHVRCTSTVRLISTPYLLYIFLSYLNTGPCWACQRRRRHGWVAPIHPQSSA
jgi:hypothetical protein